MTRAWRRAAIKAISRNDHRNALAGAVAGLGGAIAIGVMEWFAVAAHYPLGAIDGRRLRLAGMAATLA